MKVVERTLEVERVGTRSENSFTIKATSKAFDILSSGLYSDKIRAIVRELSCNAYDSHVAKGCADRPIEVTLPSYLEPTFAVKDYGTGLDHEDVMKLYTTYFESTKTNSDDFIGQLGLGSKSPFSYTSTFTVESRFNGVLRTYCCFKDEHNMPAITQLSERETDEENGLTVSLAVKTADITKFEWAARAVFAHFDPQPQINGVIGFVPISVEYTVCGSGWKLLNDDCVNAETRGVRVVQGLVSYPVDTSLVLDGADDELAVAVAKLNISLFVPIGEVEVAASREALSYTKHTIANLRRMFDVVASEIRSRIQAQFDECKNQWEAAKLYTTLSNGTFASMFVSLQLHTPFVWNGEDVMPQVRLDLSSIEHTNIEVCKLVRSRTGKRSTVRKMGDWTPAIALKDMQYQVTPQLEVFVDTDVKLLPATVKNYLLQHSGKMLLVIRPVSKQRYVQAEIDEIVRQLGAPAYIRGDDWRPTTTTRKRSYSKTQQRQVCEKLVFAGFPKARSTSYYMRNKLRRVFSRLTWELKTIDVNTGGFYVLLDGFKPEYTNLYNNDHIDDVITHAAALKLLPAGTKVIGASKADLKDLESSSAKWHNLPVYLQQAIDSKVADGTFVAASTLQHIKGCISEQLFELLENESFISQLPSGGPIVELAAIIKDLSEKAADYSTETVAALYGYLNAHRPTATNKTKLTELIGQIEQKYVLLHQNWSRSGLQEWRDHAVTYIRTIDAQTVEAEQGTE